MLNLNKNRKKDSRRDFFKTTGAFFCAISIPTFSNAEKVDYNDDNGFVIVDGWVLKKKDIHDLQPK